MTTEEPGINSNLEPMNNSNHLDANGSQGFAQPAEEAKTDPRHNVRVFWSDKATNLEAKPQQFQGRGATVVRKPRAQEKETFPSKEFNPGPERVRVSKLLSEQGLCSRREADEFISRGWVFVDGQPVSILGMKVDPGAKVSLSRDALAQINSSVTIIMNKPIGYVSGQPEDGYEPAVRLIGPDTQVYERGDLKLKREHMEGLAPAGRLDIDSTGLLIFTQNGTVAKALIGENSDIEKEYLVRVAGSMAEDGLALLRHGLELDGISLKPARVEWLNRDQLRIMLREGRKRQIRRMCELVGLKVTGLKRVRIGSLRLGSLPEGHWRYMRPDEQF
jgi:23S rRNA pseudouridine2604 synthase